MGTFKFNAGGNPVMDYYPIQGEKKYCKHLCIIKPPFFVKFWAKNCGSGLYMRQLLSEGAKGLVGVINWTENLQ